MPAKRKPARKIATATDLLKKPARRREHTIRSVGDDGEDVELVVSLQAIGAAKWDAIVAECPPSAEQRKEGLGYNVEKFAPRLVAACAVEPRLSEEEAEELFASDTWNNWETQQLFLAAARLCNQDVDVPFTAGASETTPPST